MAEELPKIHVRVREVTERISERSRVGRADYLARMDEARQRGSARAGLSCTNLAHGFAAAGAPDKEALKLMRRPNVAIVSAYNDTNHTLHLVAIAHCAGIAVDRDDFSDLSSVVPLLARIHPNGSADVNRFHVAGGMAFLIRELIEGGFLQGDTMTVMGRGLSAYAQ